MSGQKKTQPRPSPDRQGKGTPTAASPKARPSAPRSDLKNNLRSQTPLNRRLRQQTTPREPGTSRRATNRQYYRVKSDRKERRGIFGMRVLLTFLCYAVLLSLSLLLVSFWLPHHSTPETSDFIYQIGSDKNYISKETCSWSTVRRGDIYYLDMNGLASYCNLATTGDSEKIRYIVKETGETVEFVLGQSVAYVNGIPERIEGDVYSKNGKIYAPLAFVSRTFLGLDVTLDLEKHKITLLRQTDENDDPLVLSFHVKAPATTPAIDFDSLDLTLQNQILYPVHNDNTTTDNTTDPS